MPAPWVQTGAALPCWEARPGLAAVSRMDPAWLETGPLVLELCGIPRTSERGWDHQELDQDDAGAHLGLLGTHLVLGHSWVLLGAGCAASGGRQGVAARRWQPPCPAGDRAWGGQKEAPRGPPFLPLSSITSPPAAAPRTRIIA